MLDLNNISAKEIWTVYQQIIELQESGSVSGADVVSQVLGEITFFKSKEFEARTLAWNFSDLGYFIVRTGQKIATHTHLKEFKKELPMEEMTHLVLRCEKALLESDWSLFIDSIDQYHQCLLDLDLVHARTKVLLQNLRNQVPIEGAKGCGALGADTFIVFFKNENKKEILKYLQKQCLKVVGDSLSLSGGLKIEMSPMKPSDSMDTKKRFEENEYSC